MCSARSLGYEASSSILRTAQPAVVVCLADPNPAVRQRAIETCEYRADMGADLGLAVPMLLTLRGDPDAEIRELVERALGYAEKRLRGTLAAGGIAIRN